MVDSLISICLTRWCYLFNHNPLERKHWQDMVNKGSHFVDFVRLRPHPYTRTQRSLPPLWAAIRYKKMFSGLSIYIQAIIYSLLRYLHDCTLKSSIRCYFRKILVSVQKCIYLNKKTVLPIGLKIKKKWKKRRLKRSRCLRCQKMNGM